MDKVVHTYVFRFLIWGGILLCFAIALLGVTGYFRFLSFISAYLLSFVFVGSNFWIVRRIKLKDHAQFTRIFYATLAWRFILVLAAFILLFEISSGEQIFFTVSFLISYICHSVLEIVAIKRILKINRRK
jgi:phosphatidylserine synthase